MPHSQTSDVNTSAIWRRVDVTHGLGHGCIRANAEGAHLRASEIVHDEDLAYSVAFTVETDADWSTTAVHVEAIASTESRRLTLHRSMDGVWTEQGRELPALNGCIDVDVAATPVTNTLPIRRTRLQVGQASDLSMAWIDVPTLEVRLSRQRYERLEPEDGFERYVYSDDTHGPYVLTVDRDGVVVDYEGLARRVGYSQP